MMNRNRKNISARGVEQEKQTLVLFSSHTSRWKETLTTSRSRGLCDPFHIWMTFMTSFACPFQLEKLLSSGSASLLLPVLLPMCLRAFFSPMTLKSFKGMYTFTGPWRRSEDSATHYACRFDHPYATLFDIVHRRTSSHPFTLDGINSRMIRLAQTISPTSFLPTLFSSASPTPLTQHPPQLCPTLTPSTLPFTLSTNPPPRPSEPRFKVATFAPSFFHQIGNVYPKPHTRPSPCGRLPLDDPIIYTDRSRMTTLVIQSRASPCES